MDLNRILYDEEEQPTFGSLPITIVKSLMLVDGPLKGRSKFTSRIASLCSLTFILSLAHTNATCKLTGIRSVALSLRLLGRVGDVEGRVIEGRVIASYLPSSFVLCFDSLFLKEGSNE